MMYEEIYSDDPTIIIVEEDPVDGIESYYVYCDGSMCGIGHNYEAALEIAEEVFAAVTGDPLEEV